MSFDGSKAAPDQQFTGSVEVFETHRSRPGERDGFRFAQPFPRTCRACVEPDSRPNKKWRLINASET